MDGTSKLNIVLFALTGFGNTVLEALLKDARVQVGAVFTVKYDNPFPYYSERQLIELCGERGVDCYHGVNVRSREGIGLVRKYTPHLIIVATFKQILDEAILGLPPLGVVNFHPSLLPRYRGPCPTGAALYNDEKVTGVTLHYITEKLDQGDILLQRSIAIGKADNDGQLRQRLAKLAGEMAPEMIGMFANFTKPAGTPQDHRLASAAPRLTAEDGYLERATDIDSIRRKIRAFNPFPGTSILLGDRRVAVDGFELCQDGGPDGLCESNSTIDLTIDSRTIRLHKKIDR